MFFYNFSSIPFFVPMNQGTGSSSSEALPHDGVPFTPSSDVDNSSSTIESGLSKDDVDEEELSSDLEEEAQAGEEVVICDLCGQVPCDWDTFGKEIWEECNGLKDQGMDNKAVCYHAYRMYTRLRHGVLHCFDRRPLPVCVQGEIMDEWLDPNHEYVGLQAAMRDAATES